MTGQQVTAWSRRTLLPTNGARARASATMDSQVGLVEFIQAKDSESTSRKAGRVSYLQRKQILADNALHGFDFCGDLSVRIHKMHTPT